MVTCDYVLAVECIRWADLRKICKLELTRLDDRHDMDGVGKGGI